jgi:hypothetical protein
MKFLCLCYYDPQQFASLSAEEICAIPDSCQPYNEALRATQAMTILGSLSEPGKCKSIRPVNGKPTVKAGTILDTKEQIGAFFIVEAADIEEATYIASHHPSAHLGNYFGGGIEVKACEMFEQY